ncbi:hypothetical protein NDU88_007330 [Pleurodeles waltl]|uniref:Uncharacterized protein n=1 Tax=Pleurodeles waltl TaxID=8319 RepID=A0AAV7QLH7_PLEWA|nr:hypothetical protein NDU88_007330 [Pleurodeles waltl]
MTVATARSHAALQKVGAIVETRTEAGAELAGRAEAAGGQCGRGPVVATARRGRPGVAVVGPWQEHTPGREALSAAQRNLTPGG